MKLPDHLRKYLENRADIRDGNADGPVPNTAMALLRDLDENDGDVELPFLYDLEEYFHTVGATAFEDEVDTLIDRLSLIDIMEEKNDVQM